jgi:hypothetical protein
MKPGNTVRARIDPRRFTISEIEDFVVGADDGDLAVLGCHGIRDGVGPVERPHNGV